MTSNTSLGSAYRHLTKIADIVAMDASAPDIHDAEGKMRPVEDEGDHSFKKPSGPFKMPSLPLPRAAATPATCVQGQLKDEVEPAGPVGKSAGGGGGGEGVAADAADAGRPAPGRPFRPPAWAGCPDRPFSLEVLRGGRIVETIDLRRQPCFVFGRLPDCDVQLEHPSISRHHAVLLFRKSGDEAHPSGYYLYDLGSTHGTLLNKAPVQARVYCRMRVGHICKFGGSSRLFVLQGPEEDQEDESELTVTELKAIGQERRERLARLEQADQEQEEEQQQQKQSAPAQAGSADDDGISWGMGEDADEASDLQFNPFALGEAEDEQLYLVDPKRTLRGWFDREGHELEYQTEELAGGRHVCRVQLPLDTTDGRPLVAEAQHVGKKKEAVFQCALEACRMLDRAGLLRQARQESRRRRRKPSDADSDEDDAFLDRTGAVERKRQRRLEVAGGRPGPAKAETYQSLLLQYQKVQSDALALERRLAEGEAATQSTTEQAADVDELDAFMTKLSRGGVTDRQERRNLKTQLTQLRTEESRLCRLVNLARPVSMPALRPPAHAAAVRSPLTGIIGKRKKGGASTVRSAAALRSVQRPVGPERSPASQPPVEEEDEEGNVVAGPGVERLTASRPPVEGEDGEGDVVARPQEPERLTASRQPVEAEDGEGDVVARPPGPERLPTSRPPVEAEDGEGDVVARPQGPQREPAVSPPASRHGTEGGEPGRTPSDGSAPDGRVSPLPSMGRQQAAAPVSPPGTERRGPPARPGAAGPAAHPALAAAGAAPAGDAAQPPPHGAGRAAAAVRSESERAAEGGSRAPPPHAQSGGRHARTVRPKQTQGVADSYSDLAGDGSYDVWLPPENQTGDGRTSLNDKYGY